MPSAAAIDATAALACLLADAGLRARFRVDRDALLAEMRVEGANRAALQKLNVDDLDRQALALIAKRASEVARLLPQTFARGGPELREAFHGHAIEWWPAGHRRHLLDALAFAERLAACRHGALVGRELNRLRFKHTGRRAAVHWCGFSLQSCHGAPGLQVLLRDHRGVVREFRLGLTA